MRALVIIGAIVTGLLGGSAGAAAQTTTCTGYTDPSGNSSIRCTDSNGVVQTCGGFNDGRNAPAQSCGDQGPSTNCYYDQSGYYMCTTR